MSALLQAVVRLCGDASAAILDVYAGPVAVDRKADRSPVTAADRAAHGILCQGLATLTPGVPVVSEEGDPAEHAPARPAGEFWLVDPLDGTKEFLSRTGEFTVNVALVRDGRPAAGVVHVPVSRRSYVGDLHADGGPRAWRIDGDGTVAPLRTRPGEPDRVRIAASRDHGGPFVAAVEARGGADGVSVLRAGSSLKFCLVAEGQADLYVRDGRTMEWDTAAAQAVLEAAGGAVLDFEGTPLGYGKPTSANPPFLAVGDPGLEWLDFLRRYRD